MILNGCTVIWGTVATKPGCCRVSYNSSFSYSAHHPLLSTSPKVKVSCQTSQDVGMLPFRDGEKKSLETSMSARAALATAFSISRSSVPSPAAKLVPRRGLASGGDHHGPPKVNIWEDPLSPSKWKEEHLVLASLAGWFLLGYGGYKLFSGKKGKKEESVGESAK